MHVAVPTKEIHREVLDLLCGVHGCHDPSTVLPHTWVATRVVPWYVNIQYLFIFIYFIFVLFCWYVFIHEFSSFHTLVSDCEKFDRIILKLDHKLTRVINFCLVACLVLDVINARFN